jgi:hypothetical protein
MTLFLHQFENDYMIVWLRLPFKGLAKYGLHGGCKKPPWLKTKAALHFLHGISRDGNFTFSFISHD